jgi:hypothetical protein
VPDAPKPVPDLISLQSTPRDPKAPLKEPCETHYWGFPLALTPDTPTLGWCAMVPCAHYPVTRPPIFTPWQQRVHAREAAREVAHAHA